MHKRLFDSVILVWILALLPVLVLVGLWLHFAITCPPLPNGITTQGSYRYNSEQWLPLEEDVPDALDGDLYLSVRATTAVPENQRLYFFLDHIEAEISLNGETLFQSEDECSPQWAYFLSPGITQDDTLVIRLHNPHSYGNRRAYNAFLGSLHSQPYDHAGLPLPPMNLAMILLAVFVCVTAILVLGIAATTCLMQKPSGGKMLNLGLVTLLAGLYMVLDAPQKPLWLTGYTYFTPLKSVCLMLGVFELGLFARFNFGGIMRRIVNVVTAAEGILAGVVICVSVTNFCCMYNAMGLWYVAQLILCPTLMVCLFREAFSRRAIHKRNALSCALLALCLLLDIINIYFELLPDGILTKLCFLALFFYYVLYNLKRIPEGFQASERSAQLEAELRNTQTALAMSQIRSHFIFNILNAISGMCKYDPEMADETVVRFARYLRTNIDIMQQEKIVTFDTALQHLQDYVALEQIRFGNKIRFRQEIRVDGFLIPSLVLQPVVENAIKHGLTPKAEGGTVFLKSWTDGKSFIISIQDDGIGFDPTTAPKKENGGLGLENVRSRLDQIMKGTMVIDSKPGEGTTVTITIPRKESFRCI